MKEILFGQSAQMLRGAWIAAAFVIGSAAYLAPPDACAQSVRLQAQTSEIYDGMPFQLSVVVSDFDESPQPEVDAFAIEDADVRFLGVSPRISSMTTIINGRRTSKKDVTFVYSYQITPKREGAYSIPVITARQGAKTATSEQRVTFAAQTVQTTPDMKIVLDLPDRKLWVGETFEARISWYLRKDVSTQSFSLPILQMPDVLDVEEPAPTMQGNSIPLSVGSRQVAFPYARDNVTYRGLEYTRFLITAKLTPLKSGVITIEPSKVLAELESGTARDAWGFGRTTYKLYRAQDEARIVEVRELPQNGRPATFSNAMGADYSIRVRADRTIVKAGDPILLTIDISSPSSLEGLILPSLTDAGLKEQLFGVPNESPIGENIEGAQKIHIKRFTVPIRVKSDRVTEIPPLSFSYFNPAKEEYSTVRSQPIALSVTASEKVSAADVVGARAAAQGSADADAAGERTQGGSPAQDAPDAAAGGVDLGLMTPGEDVARQSMLKAHLTAILAAIYAFPFAVLGVMQAVRRSRRTRSRCADQRAAARELSAALADAQKDNARDAASKISNAMNQFLKVTQTPRAPFASLCEQIDVEAYRPDAANRPLTPETVAALRAEIPKHVPEKYAKWISGLFLCLFCLCAPFSGASAQAQTAAEQTAGAAAAVSDGQTPGAADQAPGASASGGGDAPAAQHQGAISFETARAAYRKALETRERSARIAAFKRAQAYFAQLAAASPDDPSYLVNAGNAALGAADMGNAALNYKRALILDPSNEQARGNLAYVQTVQGEKVRLGGNDISSAFFFNRMMMPHRRLILAALFFALGILLMLPWSAKSRKVLSFAGIVPLIAWVWLMAGHWTAPQTDEGVIMSEVWLKTADNPGASNVSATPLEPGFGVEILKTRDGWVQVRYGDGMQGWISQSAVEHVGGTK